jgi:predicted aldo/keto reductase-like oxidoreductase
MKNNYIGEDIKKLGFGFMRLPEADGKIDIEQVKEMVDLFMSKGFTYYDTAYVYHSGNSEATLKEAVVDRYPREAFQIATKMPLWIVNEQSDYQKYFDDHLARTGAGYFDFYLLHNVGYDILEKHEKLGAWEFLKSLKERGLAKYTGFSSHNKAAQLDEILTRHPDTDFVQLQINYVDWEDPEVESRKCYEVAMKHGVPVIIMEPVRGGSLASFAPQVRDIFTAANPEASLASWAIRYCASLDGVITVLSGMSTPEQVRDNVDTMSNFKPLTDEERKTIEKALELIKGVETIPCTGCKYCVDDCPQKIAIPHFIKVENEYRIYDDLNGAKRSYGFALHSGAGPASSCIECGACEGHCPQNIPIMEALKGIAAKFA